MSSILLVALNSIDLSSVEPLVKVLHSTFGYPVRILPTRINPDFAYDPLRKQYNSSAMLSHLIEKFPDYKKVVGITDLDLFIPILTFVFGEAQLDGLAAIISTTRLHNDFYGMPPDTILEKARLEKEVIHELGHTFGLIHCRELECVMHSTTYVEEIDLKPSNFCPSCQRLLDKQNSREIQNNLL